MVINLNDSWDTSHPVSPCISGCTMHIGTTNMLFAPTMSIIAGCSFAQGLRLWFIQMALEQLGSLFPVWQRSQREKESASQGMNWRLPILFVPSLFMEDSFSPINKQDSRLNR